MNSYSIFRSPLSAALLALTAAVAWGFAYPLIKLGFAAFGITPDLTGSKMLFAGIRFCISGFLILALAVRSGKTLTPQRSTDWGFILFYALLGTTFHYTFFYIGLSHAPGARSAILNSLSVFSVVILACLFFKSDRMSARKIWGCVLGFAGIVVLNVGDGAGGAFSFWGDGMIILNALCGAGASLLTRGLHKRIDVFVGTGYSLAVGGLLLVAAGMFLDGSLPHVTVPGLVYLALLIGISTVGFGLYNKLLTCNPVGKIAIYNSLIPVVGATASCLCLGETFYTTYIIATALAAAGIYIINKGKA